MVIECPQQTPASKSDLNSSLSQLQRDFECIPLQALHSELCEALQDGHLFYADEFGNYVFPVVAQPACSCTNR